MNNSLKSDITNVFLIALALAAMSCLVSLMILFMGGGQAGVDLNGLMILQAGITPVALVAAGLGLYRYVRSDGWAAGTRRMWRAIPQWLVFIFLMFNSLVIMGEVAFLIVLRATDEVVRWHEHIPLVCVFACSAAFLVLYARANSSPGSPPAMSGRWMQD